MKLGYRSYYTFIVIIMFAPLANFAKAYCLDCGDAHQPADAFPDIIGENAAAIGMFVRSLFFLLLIWGIYKIYKQNKPLMHKGNGLFMKSISSVKFLLLAIYNIFLLFVVTWFFGLLFYFVSSITISTFFGFLGYPSSDVAYREDYEYILLIVYSSMAYGYTKLKFGISQKLNKSIVAAITLLVFWVIYTMPLMIIG